MAKYEFPKDHQPGMRVPKGGSSCAKCKYLKPGNRCGNEYFQQWHGSDKIPAPAAEYCSDWFEAGERTRQTAGDQLREQREKK